MTFSRLAHISDPANTLGKRLSTQELTSAVCAGLISKRDMFRLLARLDPPLVAVSSSGQQSSHNLPQRKRPISARTPRKTTHHMLNKHPQRWVLNILVRLLGIKMGKCLRVA